jgi:hypothetical protein
LLERRQARRGTAQPASRANNAVQTACMHTSAVEEATEV